MSIEAKITEPKMPGIKGALRMAHISIPMGGPALQGTDPLLMAEGYELAAKMLRNGWAFFQPVSEPEKVPRHERYQNLRILEQLETPR
ncbi:MAG TPA: hypothetical protein PK735_14025 [Flavobacteriales bacterium]|nr:hypothetical protein [Flavobacteriales bacterium]